MGISVLWSIFLCHVQFWWILGLPLAPVGICVWHIMGVLGMILRGLWVLSVDLGTLFSWLRLTLWKSVLAIKETIIGITLIKLNIWRRHSIKKRKLNHLRIFLWIWPRNNLNIHQKKVTSTWYLTYFTLHYHIQLYIIYNHSFNRHLFRKQQQIRIK